jgi:hypothetical protein
VGAGHRGQAGPDAAASGAVVRQHAGRGQPHRPAGPRRRRPRVAGRGGIAERGRPRPGPRVQGEPPGTDRPRAADPGRTAPGTDRARGGPAATGRHRGRAGAAPPGRPRRYRRHRQPSRDRQPSRAAQSCRRAAGAAADHPRRTGRRHVGPAEAVRQSGLPLGVLRPLAQPPRRLVRHGHMRQPHQEPQPPRPRSRPDP